MIEEHIGLRGRALMSPCETYRYGLVRQWNQVGGAMVVIGLNPSTADADQDDPTIRRCIGFAKREGCGELIMINLFALRATDPKELLAHHAPIGPDNDMAIKELAAVPGCVMLAAWGAHPAAVDRWRSLRHLGLGRLMCLGKTAGGAPRHPLYVRGDQPLIVFDGGKTVDVSQESEKSS